MKILLRDFKRFSNMDGIQRNKADRSTLVRSDSHLALIQIIQMYRGTPSLGLDSTVYLG